MSCAASRQFTRENGDYLVTANEVIHSPRCSYQVRVGKMGIHVLYLVGTDVLMTSS